MYLLQPSESRTCAPRGVYRLCIVCVQFSAMHSRRLSGKWKFISAGASVPGVIWNTTRTPSMTSSVPVALISSVGGMRLTVPSEVVLPRPASTWPRGPAGSSGANMYSARRSIAGPAMTFSLTASARNPSGAMTRQRPASTSSCVVTPRTPAKWSRWLWV